MVDLTTTFMGPYSAAQLARLGADVIKVEAPGGDSTRGINDTHGTGLGPIFLSANHGKRALAIDLKAEGGREAFLTLVKSADVFMTNMRPQALARLGISAKVLTAEHPGLVCALLVGFGEGGRYAGLAAYDDVIQAVSGMAAVQGEGGEPEYVKSSLTDKIVGIMTSNAIIAALYQRATTGSGSVVTIPMFESMVAFNLLEHQGGYVYDPPQGPTLYRRVTSPHRKPYRTADGYIGVVVYTDRMWLSFFDLIGRSDLVTDPRYATIRERTTHIDELYALVEDTVASQTSDYWIEALSERSIPVIPMRSIDELFDDPHLRDVDFFETVEHAVAGRLRLPKTAISFSTGLPEQLRPAPVFGEHSVDVLLEAGVDPAVVDDLLARGVIGVPDQSVDAS